MTSEGDGGSSSSGSVCAGCGKPIDPLRAGHVAIVDGTFRYFCNAACKVLYVEASPRRAAFDAMTAEPPPVAPVSQPIAPIAMAATGRATLPGIAPEATPSHDASDDGDDEVVTPPWAQEPVDSVGEQHAAPLPRDANQQNAFVGAPFMAPNHGILESAPLADSEGAMNRAPAPLQRALGIAPAIGIGAGIVAAAAPLAGELASKFCLPLAMLAAFVVVMRAGLRPRDPSEPSPWIVAVPVAIAAITAATTFAMVGRVPAGKVDAYAAFVGVAAAASLLVDLALGRARRDVEAARTRMARATSTGTDHAWGRLANAQSSRLDVAAPLVGFMRRAVELAVPIAAVIVAVAAYATSRDAWPEVWPDVVIAACAGAYALAAVAAASAAALAHAHGHLSALRRGIVYKDAQAFDVAARADVAVICSRGTVLLGEPEIVTVEAIGDIATDRVLSLAAGTEMASNPAASTAILGEARAREVRPEHVRSAIVYEGLGVTALAPDGDKVIVGSRGLLLQEKVSVAIFDARVTELEAEGRSVLLVALGDRSIGLLALQDGLRRGARAAIQRLHDAGIEPVLLSGEARETCETIARALDIEHVRPEILPADRGAEVRALADGGHVVAAIGHASSDGGALGSADVPVAMGQAGPVPGEWSVALASDDVRDAALALTVPRACRERARVIALVGAGAQALSLFGIVFGIAPPVVAPVVSVIAAVIVVGLVREPPHAPAPSPLPPSSE
ncbi:MAG: HAD family hydrolase [Polyangiaceae bacterium]|nr:HAD family hydrolase [Polyangiaceae bacterium]